MRSISLLSCVNSFCSWPDWLPMLAELACVASSFMRSRIDETVCVAPSMTCSIELAWATFFCAWPRPFESERSLLAMARPAASSPARLIRKPEERRWIDCWVFFSFTLM